MVKLWSAATRVQPASDANFSNTWSVDTNRPMDSDAVDAGSIGFTAGGVSAFPITASPVRKKRHAGNIGSDNRLQAARLGEAEALAASLV